MELDYLPSDVLEVLNDPRVLRMMAVALRDQAIRRRFNQLRMQLVAVNAITTISAEYSLSEERVRTIVYRKGTYPTESAD